MRQALFVWLCFMGALLLLMLVAGCAPLPLATASARNPVALNVYPLPSCVLFCNAHVSALREDVSSVGSAGAVTGGAPSNQQSSTGSVSRP